MIFRFFIPGLILLSIMGLIFITPIELPYERFFGFLPSRSIVNGLVFAAFTHNSISALKKQMRYDLLKRNAYAITSIFTLSVALGSEVLIYLFEVNPFFNYWNLILDLTGIGFGLLSFYLLYRKYC